MSTLTETSHDLIDDSDVHAWSDLAKLLASIDCIYFLDSVNSHFITPTVCIHHSLSFPPIVRKPSTVMHLEISSAT